MLSGSLRLPALAPWAAAVDVHAPTADATVSGPASLIFTRLDGTQDTFTGTVAQAELDPGARLLAVVLVGGAGKLDTEIPAADQASTDREIPLGLVVKGIVEAAGEQLEAGVEAELDKRTVKRWTRFTSTARAELDLITAALGLTWRVTPAGRIWVGVDTFPAGASVRRVGFELGDGAVTIAPDGAPALPGTTITAQGASSATVRAVEVLYQVGATVRASVRAAVPGDPPRRLDLERYARTYPARVVAQDSSGLLELAPDGAALGTLRAVPLRLGIPGAQATLPAGARVRVAFEGGWPTGACAVLHDEDRASSGLQPLALVGDSCGHLTAVAPPGGGPCTLVIASTPSPGSVEIVVAGPGHAYVKGKRG